MMRSKNKATTILFIFLLVFLMLPIYKVNASTTYDFESDGLGAVPAGWVDASSAACSARVSNDVAHGGTKSVKIIDGNNNGWGILDIAAQFDETEITYWIYMFDTNRLLACYTYEDGTPSDILGIVYFGTDGKIYAYDVMVPIEIVATYNKEQWYKVRIVHNIAGNTYDVYIDDSLEADDFDFFNGAANSFKSVRFITGKTINLGTMGYIDDVTIGDIIEPPSDPNLLFGAGFNASNPYVELHWNHSLERVLVFEVQNSTDGISFDFLGNSTTANYTDTQVLNGTERYYRVRANNYTDGTWYNSSFTEINFETVYFAPSADGPTVIQNVTGAWFYYNLTTINVTVGVHDAGDLNSTLDVDENTYNCSEVVGVPGYVIEFEWTDVDQDSHCLWVTAYIFYDGVSAHTINVDLWNFTSTAWVTIGIIYDMVDFEWVNSSIYDLRMPNDFINSTGAVRGRFYHSSAGNINDDIHTDFLKLYAFIPFEDEAVTEQSFFWIFIAIVLSIIVGLLMWLKYEHNNN